jgi:hypothetical protein
MSTSSIYDFEPSKDKDSRRQLEKKPYIALDEGAIGKPSTGSFLPKVSLV